ncbi:uncharacterized protein FA14DRAFT_20027 [Meira miltonrushii]|uniref:Uncharacterized protein n=1 Tax=Meira miltonrushii TaxID=1280837 RepID=A0A316VJT6_9BASI|nr:uncharacterized protein FA14DRAFT_20027 [Meira miltonrushii]PWN37869.1 hypothetical protein FA14DRAFT_20027 [Meira miltonrushii]
MESDSTADLQAMSNDQLKEHLQKIRSNHASLKAEIERVRTIPSSEEMQEWVEANSRVLPQTLVDLSQRIAVAEEKCILHRTAGWTVFEIDLDIGRRERQMRREEGRSKLGKSSLGLGVRLDTFFRGRFHEPYYLIFAKQSQLLDNKAKVTNSALDAGKLEARYEMEARDDDDDLPHADSEEDEDGMEAVRLIRHTIPLFVPLQTLIKQYLGQDGGMVSERRRGGLDLLDGLMSRNGMTDFLGKLHTYLQVFVCRREQTIGLKNIRLPGEHHSELIAYANDAFDMITIRWAVPMVSMKDVDEYERQNGIVHPRASTAEEQSTLMHKRRLRYEHARGMARRSQTGDRVRNVEIKIQFTNLFADALGKVDPEYKEPEKSSDEFKEGRTLFENGTVRIEHQRPKKKRKRRENSPEIFHVATRRSDCEVFFANETGQLENAVQQSLIRIFADHLERESEMDKCMTERFLKGELKTGINGSRGRNKIRREHYTLIV